MGLREFFSRKEENPFFKKNKKVFKAHFSEISKIYLITTFVKDQYDSESLRTAIDQDNLLEYCKAFKFNTQADNIELYYVVEENHQHIMVVLDPYEVYEPQQPLKIFKDVGKVQGVENCEVIYDIR